MEWMQYVITALIVDWVKFHKQWEFDLNGYSTSTSALCINSRVQMTDLSICLFVLLQVHVTSIWPQRFKFVGTFVCLFLLVLFVLVQVHVSSVWPRSFKFVDIFACLTPRRFLIAKHCTLPASSNFILASCLSLILRNAYCLLLSVSFVSFPEIKPKHYLGLRMFGLTGIIVGRCCSSQLCLLLVLCLCLLQIRVDVGRSYVLTQYQL